MHQSLKSQAENPEKFSKDKDKAELFEFGSLKHHQNGKTCRELVKEYTILKSAINDILKSEVIHHECGQLINQIFHRSRWRITPP